jgi:hypothetical protein
MKIFTLNKFLAAFIIWFVYASFEAAAEIGARFMMLLG